jgi:uncharacterized protein
MDDRLIIYIEDIPQDGWHVEGELSPAALALDGDAFAHPAGPLQYALDISLVSHEFLVHGAVAAEMEMCCSRCSVFFPVAVSEQAYNYDEELSETTESVDLTEDMREAIILAFPSYPVCSRDCKGLCPQCGANKNKGECQCKPPADNRWAALDGLG